MIIVEQTGPLTLIEDLGRSGYAQYGVPTSGAADRCALRRANRWVGNADDEACLEILLGGLVFTTDAALLCAISGARGPIEVNGVPVSTDRRIRLGPGDRVALGVPESGLRSYLAVAGGFDIAPVLGSRSTDLLSGLGPAPVQPGDRIPIGSSEPRSPAGEPIAAPQPEADVTVIDLEVGPRADWFTDRSRAALLNQDWTITQDSDRTAVRLTGQALQRRATTDEGAALPAELPSEGLIRGAIQVPPSGQPLIFGADHPVTGGYPVIAVVTSQGCDRLAQLRPGERLRFRQPAAQAHGPDPLLSGARRLTVGISKVLVANRGEIAVRVVRAAADAGLGSVAVYAEPDADALFVQLADEAYALGGSTPADTYLDAAKIIAVAERSGADAIHPGYGFLAENAAFAKAVIDAGLTWIGPPPAAIEALGDKVQARHIAQRVGAPLVPGTADPVADADEVINFAEQHGLPIAIKAAYGGGGRGIKVARAMAEIPDLYESAVREAVSAFGRGECFVERFLDHPRHVETQCLADQHGAVVVVSTRDCSLQRRNQKLVEEAPAPYLTDDQQRTLYEASKAILQEAGYVGAGTCEFLVGTDGTISFLEVNTRLQVEHPVSEQVTGLDLVREMFRIADGEELGYADPEAHGHAIEFRINAEDPGRGFLPAPGTLTDWQPPSGPGVRVDEGYRNGMAVPGSFDSLIAKIIVTGSDRTEAIERSRRALAETRVGGMPTVLPFHRAVLDDPAFVAADAPQRDGSFDVHTRWIETEFDNRIPPYEPAPSDQPVADQSAGPERTTVTVEVNGKRMAVTLPAGLGTAPAQPATTPRRPVTARRDSRDRQSAAAASGNAVSSPMQGTIVKVAVADGDQVAAGDLIVVLEAMKMEQPLTAHRDGRISGLSAAVGDTLTSGAVLCEIVD